MTRSRTGHSVVTMLVTGGVAVALGAGLSPATAAPRATAGTSAVPGAPAAAPAGSRALARGPSAVQPKVAVLGSDGSRVLWATEGLSPDDGGRPTLYVGAFYRVAATGGPVTTLKTLDDGLAAGGSSAGSTYLYTGSMGDPMYLDFASGANGPDGPGPVGVAFPGGAVDIGTGGVLTVQRFNGTQTTLGAVPDIAPAGAQLIADTHGVLARHGTVIDYFSLASHTSTRLDTTGITSAAFRCSSVTAGAVGCTDGSTVYRIPTNGSAPTKTTSAHVGRVVVTPTTTAWVSTADGRLSTRIGATTTRTSYAVTSAFAVGDDIAFSREGATAGGVYRTASAGGRATLLARAPVLGLHAQAVAVTAGRVSWIDDSTTAHPVRSRRLLGQGAGYRVGPAVRVNPGSLVLFPDLDGYVRTTDLALSDTRSAFVARPVTTRAGTTGTLLLATGAGVRVVATGADGDVAVSGSRLLWATGSGQVLLRNLATGATRNLTTAYGVSDARLRDPQSAGFAGGVLYGRYLAYAKGGSAWRLDLASGDSTPLGHTDATPGVGGVLTAGDFLAWPAAGGVEVRNARTKGPVTRIAHQSLVSISQAGLITAGPAGTVFRTWSGSVHPVPSTGGATRADAGFLAFISASGLPEIAPFEPSAARPQALGAPLAAASVRAGAGWTLDQPTSQPLASCTVVIRTPAGKPVATLPCLGASAGQGEAVGHWTARVGGRNAPAGRYTWQLVGRNSSGSVLSSTGSSSMVSGAFEVTR